ncbi:MAG: Fe-S cluster assembly protein HesB, partial [Ornithinibacter sp.]
MVTLTIAQDPTADRVLSQDPFALLTGMLLDQQFPMESAFAGPWKLKQRLGHLDVRAIAEMDPDELTAAMRQTPVVHRYPASMAG